LVFHHDFESLSNAPRRARAQRERGREKERERGREKERERASEHLHVGALRRATVGGVALTLLAAAWRSGLYFVCGSAVPGSTPEGARAAGHELLGTDCLDSTPKRRQTQRSIRENGPAENVDTAAVSRRAAMVRWGCVGGGAWGCVGRGACGCVSGEA